MPSRSNCATVTNRLKEFLSDVYLPIANKIIRSNGGGSHWHEYIKFIISNLKTSY